MRHAFSVRRRWVQDVLAIRPGVVTPTDFGAPGHHAFDTLLPLLRHGALGETPLQEDFALGPRVRRSFRTPRMKSFLRDARKLHGLPGGLRGAGMRFESSNALTAAFVPPTAEDVPAAIETFLEESELALAVARGPVEVATAALLASQVLVMIHPFNDGNGRTARLYFAAQLVRFEAEFASALLALPLMYREGTTAYHLAAWRFRAGNSQPMADLDLGSMLLASQLILANPPGRDLRHHAWHTLRSLR